MANPNRAYSENVPGEFFVDETCIDCDLCRQTAPNNFKRDEQSGHSFAFQQPQTPEEEALCEEAMRNCPVEAIGNDGDLAAASVAKQACLDGRC